MKGMTGWHSPNSQHMVKSNQETSPLETLVRARARSYRTAVMKYIERVLFARKGFIAYLPFFIASFALIIAALVEAFFINVDVLYYQCYATVFWFGAKTSQLLQASQCRFILPFSQFHTLPLEYPPLTLAIFSPPLLAPERAYPVVFALGMGLTAFFIYWLLLNYGRAQVQHWLSESGTRRLPRRRYHLWCVLLNVAETQRKSAQIWPY